MEAGIDLTSMITGVLPLANGGTGIDLSTLNQGDIYYDNGTTAFTRLTPGTSGQVLKTQGAGANPIWSNFPTRSVPVILRWGNIDSAPTDYGIMSNSSLIPTTVTPHFSGEYVYWGTANASYNNVILPYGVSWKKTSEISTISGTFYLWEQSGGTGGRQVSAYIDIGGQVSATSTSQSTTPTEKSWSVDVSGLTNGTVYEIKVMMRDDRGGGNSTNGGIAKIIGFES